MAHGLAHPFHLAVASLVQRELEPCPVSLAPQDAHSGRRRRPVVELDAVAKPSENLGRRRAHDVDLVDLRNPVARMRETVREIAVVRQEQRAGRVDVESPYRDDPRHLRYEIEDCPPSLGVARRRHDTGRLVQEHVREPLPFDPPPVHLDDVVRADDRVQLALHAVDPDTSGEDQLVGSAARGDARAGEVGVEAHRAIVAWLGFRPA